MRGLGLGLICLGLKRKIETKRTAFNPCYVTKFVVIFFKTLTSRFARYTMEFLCGQWIVLTQGDIVSTQSCENLE